MSEHLVGVEHHDRIAVVELRRPERRNAVGPALATALEDAVAAVNGDERVHAVVLVGAGPSFCAGADMKERLASDQGSAAVFQAVRRVSAAVHRIALPTVAAMHGHALGAGLEVAAMADYRVAERGTKLGIPEVAQGITSGGGVLALASLLPRGQLARLAYSARHIEATEAAELGVVDEIVNEGEARSQALEVAATFAQHPRAALIAAKLALRTATEWAHPQQWELLGFHQQTMEGGPAQQEALDKLRSND